MHRTLFAVLLALVATAAYVQPQPARADGTTYTATDLRAVLLGQGVPANFVVPTAISPNGRVVGTWDDESFCHTTQSFLFTPSAPNSSTGTMTNLGNYGNFSFAASGVNDNGQISATAQFNVSQCSPLSSSPILWQNGALTRLATPQNENGSARAINALGQVAGDGGFQGSTAASWTNDTFLQLSNSYSDAFAINSLGHVVGNSNALPSANAFGDAFLWDGVLHDLGREFDESTALAINDHDVVAGETSAVNHFSRAFVYSGGAMHDIDCDTHGRAAFGCSGLGTGGSAADGIDNLGQVVGQENGRAFLWDPANGMVDLNSLMPQGFNDTLTNAVAINDRGQIIATGLSSSYLLTPSPLQSTGRYGGDQLDPSHCGLTKQSKNVVNVGFRLVDDYDSGVHGNAWANDTVHRELRIWRLSPTGNTFCATVTDTAKFVTFAGDSPGGTGHVSAGIPGSFVGGEITGQFTGSLVANPPYPTSGDIGPTLSSNTFDLKCTDANTCPGARPTISSYVNGYDGRLAWWGWQYTTDANGIWTDSSDGITGDITG